MAAAIAVVALVLFAVVAKVTVVYYVNETKNLSGTVFGNSIRGTDLGSSRNYMESIQKGHYYLFHSGHYGALSLVFVSATLVLGLFFIVIDYYVYRDLFLASEFSKRRFALLVSSAMVVFFLFLRAWMSPSGWNPPDPNSHWVPHDPPWQGPR